MRFVGVGVLAVGAILAAVLGWEHIWHVLRQARWLAFCGWLLGMAGLALLIGRRKHGSRRRLTAGLVLAAVGLALMAVPSDSQGLLAGLRVGYAGCLLAVMPHCIRMYRAKGRRAAVGEDDMEGAL